MPSGYQYSREFFRRYYTPDNATIVVAGDFDAKQTLATITAAYAPWKRHLDAVRVPVEPPQHSPREAHVDWKHPTLPRTWLAWHTPAASDLKASAVQNILESYLFGKTSPLYQDLVIGRQLVDSLEASYDEHRDPNLFGVLARVKEERDVVAVEQAIAQEIEKLKKGEVDEARVEAVRSNRKYGAILRLDTADRVAVTLATTTAATGDPEYFNKLYSRMDTLKPADLVAFARKYLVDNNRTIVRLSTKAVASRDSGSGVRGGAQ
jgi:zinc protease